MIFSTSHEKQYYLVIENLHVGYNHFLLFIDRKNHALHLKDYKNAIILIYFPENHKNSGLVSYGYQSKKDDFDFGLDISGITKHEAYLELAKKVHSSLSCIN
ncbi:hypothetical protein IIE_05455 [Bacillus cereus VD045]|nr:hypothetical protein IIE_05455 [Bacillus cereus VD045]